MLITTRGGVGVGHSEPSTDWTCGSNEQRLITRTRSEHNWESTLKYLQTKIIIREIEFLVYNKTSK